ncbi:acyl carrier protein [Muricauda sp. JGD-17]|uniref:Acyl carrier protein n=1 Tax=Flagellimonas ochracea TaxID=2696472 RepID=A0A964T9X6_9FLAO|nr:acyl carrier protein [Allomuricauda ochracea]NAY90919.1 acyl carrier protein [Allomuricauda ochracea]
MENFERLKEIVTQYLPDDVDANQIKMESNFTQELNINSANLVDIVLDVEDTFDIQLENEDMDGMQTVSDALKIIENKVA